MNLTKLMMYRFVEKRNTQDLFEQINKILMLTMVDVAEFSCFIMLQ